MSILVGQDISCPHCGKGVHLAPAKLVTYQQSDMSDFIEEEEGFPDFSSIIASGKDISVQVHSALCPSCQKPILWLFEGSIKEEKLLSKYCVYPRGATRTVASEVPSHIKEDFQEAVEVLIISEKASAALSRRCLQNVLLDAGKVKQQDLSKQIDEVIKSLPSVLAEQIDSIRNIGNFAAHPIKDTNTGQIVDVEPGEAEWNLDVLEELFDHYYMKPAEAAKKRQALNAKLKAIGKPPMKKP